MKKALLFVSFAFLIQNSFTQTIRIENVFSDVIKDSIKVAVSLPENWTETKKYPVIYEFVSLSITDMDFKLLANNISFYSDYLKQIPQSIVVAIDLKKGDELGYSYNNGTVSDKGEQFLTTVQESIFPLIENKYKGTSMFRAYFGHSYTASFGNYLFLNDPSIFNSYILIAPERLDSLQPPFILNRELIEIYKHKPTSYFLASGGLDMQRRQDYAKDISEKVNGLDDRSFHFLFNFFSEADHLTILPRSIPAALEKTFESYSAYKKTDKVENALEYFNGANFELKETFGIPIEKNNPNSFFFMGQAAIPMTKPPWIFLQNTFCPKKALALIFTILPIVSTK